MEPSNSTVMKMSSQETATSDNREVEDEDSWSLFYSDSTNMAVQVVTDLTLPFNTPFVSIFVMHVPS